MQHPAHLLSWETNRLAALCDAVGDVDSESCGECERHKDHFLSHDILTERQRGTKHFGETNVAGHDRIPPIELRLLHFAHSGHT